MSARGLTGDQGGIYYGYALLDLNTGKMIKFSDIQLSSTFKIDSLTDATNYGKSLLRVSTPEEIKSVMLIKDGKDGELGPVGPKGDPGPQGPKGNDGIDGAPGKDGNQGPMGLKGDQGLPGKDGSLGTQGPVGPQGVGLSPSTPVVTPLTLATAYRPADPTKPAFISVMVDVTYTLTLASVFVDAMELRIGPDASVATGGGYRIASWRSALTGIAVSVGMSSGDRGQLSCLLPAGWYFAVRRTSGNLATISECLIQPLV